MIDGNDLAWIVTRDKDEQELDRVFAAMAAYRAERVPDSDAYGGLLLLCCDQGVPERVPALWADVQKVFPA